MSEWILQRRREESIKAILTWFPFEASMIKRTSSTLGMIDLEARPAVAVEVERAGSRLVEAARGAGRCVERIASSRVGFSTAAFGGEIGASENGCRLSTVESWAGLWVIGIVSLTGPFRRQDPLAFW